MKLSLACPAFLGFTGNINGQALACTPPILLMLHEQPMVINICHAPSRALLRGVSLEVVLSDDPMAKLSPLP